MYSSIAKNTIMAALAPVKDPEIGLGVVDLGLIYDIILDGGHLTILMTLTTPACPYGPELMAQVKQAALGIKNINEVDTELIWDPPWDPAEMASEYAKDILGIW